MGDAVTKHPRLMPIPYDSHEATMALAHEAAFALTDAQWAALCRARTAAMRHGRIDLIRNIDRDLWSEMKPEEV